MRKPSRLRAGLAAAALAVGTGGVIAAAAPASASTVRGLNLNAYCKHPGSDPASYGNSVPSATAQLPNLLAILATHKPNTVYSWFCGDPAGDSWSIDMNKACRWQYDKNLAGTASSSAYFTEESNPYSWHCT